MEMNMEMNMEMGMNINLKQFKNIYDQIINPVHEFVKDTCQGRSDDHGYKHMLEVYENSIKNYLLSDFEKQNVNTSINISEYTMLGIVALLHDVADHKFTSVNPELNDKLTNFVKNIYPFEYQIVLDIINSISFSKEQAIIQNRYEPDSEEANKYWENKFGKYTLIRNIVSDEDKKLAMGKKGLERCISYTMNKYKETYNKEITQDHLKELVMIYANEKLLILTKFMRTPIGKRDIQILHEELLEALNYL